MAIENNIQRFGIKTLDADGIGDSAIGALRSSFKKNLSTAQLMYILLHPWDFGDGNGPDSTSSESYGAELVAEQPDISYSLWFHEVFRTVIQEMDEYIDMGLVAEPDDYENFKKTLSRSHDVIYKWLQNEPDMGLDEGTYEADKDTAIDSFEDEDIE